MSDTFDVAIIGGGIIGAGIAHECAIKGLSVVLLEKGDFCSNTSAFSFKIIHGGLRYLQHLDFKRLKESASEQYYLRKNAPNLIKPLPFLVPCYGFGLKGKAALNLACSIYEFLTKERNKDLPSELVLPNHKSLSREEVIELAPNINRNGLRGGVVFYDAQMNNSDRLGLVVVKSAENEGADVRNYHEVVDVFSTYDDNKRLIKALKVRDEINSRDYVLNAKFFINASGPWSRISANLLSTNKSINPIKEKKYFSKGIQVLITEQISTHALSVESKGLDTDSYIGRGGRAYFLQPWNGSTLIGTSDTVYDGDPEDFSINKDEVKGLISEVYGAYPDKRINLENVEYAFGGLREISDKAREAVIAGEDRDGFVNTTRDEIIIDHSKSAFNEYDNNVLNLISVVGVKYTTFRSVAEEVVSLLSDKGFNLSNNSTKNKPYYSSLYAHELKEEKIKLSNSFVKVKDIIGEGEFNSIIYEYGLLAVNIFENIQNNINSETKSAYLIINSKIEQAIKHEHAKTLSDIFFRRLKETSHSIPDEELKTHIYNTFSQLSGYSKEQIEEQKKQVKGRYKGYYGMFRD